MIKKCPYCEKPLDIADVFESGQYVCPYCGTKDQNALAYFADDEGLYRLYVCEQCHTYIKAIDLRHTESEVLLRLERVMTLDLDRQGQEKGYQPGYSKVSSLAIPRSEGS